MVGDRVRFLAAKGSTYGLPTVVPWFFYAQHPSAVDHDDAGDPADSKSKQHPPSKEGGFNMFKFLARTLADGQRMFGCRRTFPRHLLHRITTLTISTVAVLFAQTIHTKQLKAESTGRPSIIVILADDQKKLSVNQPCFELADHLTVLRSISHATS